MAALLVFAGGGSGAVLRWAIAQMAPSPWGTLIANVVGSFLISLLMASPLADRELWKLALGTGAMGGFTTYSTFNHEMLQAMQAGAWATAAAQLLATVGGCLVAGALGWWVGSSLR